MTKLVFNTLTPKGSLISIEPRDDGVVNIAIKSFASHGSAEVAMAFPVTFAQLEAAAQLVFEVEQAVGTHGPELDRLLIAVLANQLRLICREAGETA